MKIILRNFLVASALLLALSTACNSDRYRADISAVRYNLTIRDLGGEIFNNNPSQMAGIIEPLKKNYGNILQTYSKVTGLGDVNSEGWNKSFLNFATDLNNANLWDDVRKVWPSTEPLRAGLENAFRHYLYYFPKSNVPRVVTCITDFNNSIIIDDSLLMISLDRYLGRHSKYYPSLGIYEYEARKMTPSYVVTDCMYAWASTEWNIEEMKYQNQNLLTVMLHEGKLEYFTKCMVPDASDTLLFGFTKKQLDFCRDNEKRIWDYLVSHDMLFSTDGFLIRKLTGEAPFTSYFTEDSPGRAVVWTAFRIIESYMKNNPGVTLKDMMENTDCQSVLQGARYHP